jgi:hypothetical protein
MRLVAMLDDLWFVADAGASTGPFTRAEVEARLADGRFQNALVWRPTWTAWEPLSKHFTSAAGTAILSAEPEQTQVQRPRSAAVTVALVLLILGATGLSVLLFGGVNFVRLGSAAAFVYAGVWISAVLMVATIAILMWRRAANSGGWFWQAGKALSAIAVLGALAFTVTFVRVTDTLYSTSAARSTFDDYELVYDPTTRTIAFEGTIGPGFADRLDALLDANAGVSVFQIVNSPGGLIDEAMAAAQHIEAYPNLSVEVLTECNSACFALFVAANNRRASYLAEFGFHRSSQITDIPAFVQSAADESEREFRGYLIERGLRAELYDRWAISQELVAVSAIELSDIGIIGQLVGEGAPVSSTQAKWLWISAMAMSAGDGFSELARAFAESSEPEVQAAAGPIFVAARADDREAIRASVAGLLPALLPRILESADPEALRTYLSASRASLEYLVSMEQWTACAGIVDGRGAPDNSIPASLIRTELTALAAAIRSADAASWVLRPLPSWAASAGQDMIDVTLADAARVGIDNARYDYDPRVRCLLTHRLLRQVERGDPTRAIVAYRWIIVQP